MQSKGKILVTGAAGFIGMHTVLKLVSDGFDVVGLDNINDYYSVELKWARLAQTGIEHPSQEVSGFLPSNRYPNYKFCKIDLHNRQVIELFEEERFDYVINLAAQAGVRYSLENPFVYVDSNVMGFMNILEGCRQTKVKHLVFASTSSVYGLNESTPFQEQDSTDHPISLYAATKKANEVMAHSYSHLYRLPATGLRFFTVYGPWGRPDMALFLFTDAILSGKPIKVYNNGDMVRDFTYVDDVVNAICATLLKPPAPSPDFSATHPVSDASSAPYRIFNVGNSSTVKLTSYIDAIEKALGIPAIREMLPIHPGDIPVTHASIDSLRIHVGYAPKVSVEQGVKNFVQWYRDYFNR